MEPPYTSGTRVSLRAAGKGHPHVLVVRYEWKARLTKLGAAVHQLGILLLSASEWLGRSPGRRGVGWGSLRRLRPRVAHRGRRSSAGCARFSRRSMLLDLLVRPVNDRISAAEPCHVVGLVASKKARDPRVASDVEPLRNLVEHARVEAAETNLVSVILDGLGGSLHKLGGQRLAKWAVITVELDYPKHLPQVTIRHVMPGARHRSSHRARAQTRTFFSARTADSKVSGSRSMKTLGL